MNDKFTLDNLQINQKAVINEVFCNRNLINRIYDLGITENSVITPIYRSPFGDPTAYLIKNAVIALRKKDSKNIIVSPI